MHVGDTSENKIKKKERKKRATGQLRRRACSASGIKSNFVENGQILSLRSTTFPSGESSVSAQPLMEQVPPV